MNRTYGVCPLGDSSRISIRFREVTATASLQRGFRSSLRRSPTDFGGAVPAKRDRVLLFFCQIPAEVQIGT